MKNQECLTRTKAITAKLYNEQVQQLETLDETPTSLVHLAKLLQELGLDDIEK
jgi:hypothetical protein